MIKKDRKEIVISETRDFKGVWIYKNLYLSREYTPNEKFLLLEIYSLSKGSKKQCYANNRHFADFIGVKENTIQKAILKLEKNGHIKREYTYREGTKEITGRIITLTQKFYDDFINESEVKEENEGVDKNPQGGGNKSTGGGGQKSIQKYNSSILSDTDLSNTREVHTSTNIDGEVHTSVSEKQTARVTRQDMQAKKDDMLNRFSEICDNSIENETIREVVKNAFRRYMNLYETYFCKVHPILTDKTLTNVCLSLSNVTDTEHNHFEWTDVYLADKTGLTGLDRMVNEHFRRTHRRETNYSITHFAKSDYLLQLAQGIIEY